MQDEKLPEFQEGAWAFRQGKKIEENPYPWTNAGWWQSDAWNKGYKKAEDDYLNDDDDD